MRYVCGCGSTAEERVEWCPTCGRSGSFYPAVSRPTRSVPEGVEVLSGAVLAARARSARKLDGAWSVVLPEGVREPFMLVIYGMPGVGKTSLALDLAEAWPGRALVLPFETGLGVAFAGHVAQREAVAPDYALPSRWAEVLDLVEGYGLVVVDTLQRSGVDPGDWRALTVERGRSVVLTSEVNAGGEVRGGLAASHVADVVIELPEFGRFRVRKNRGGGLVEGEL